MAKKNKRKKVWIRILLLLAFLAAAGFLAMNILRVREVNVTGNITIGKEEIMRISGILINDNIFKVNLGDVTRSLNENPYIEVLHAARKLPDVIEIEIRERVPFAVIGVTEGKIIIDEQGHVLEIVSPSVSANAIRVRGMHLTGYTPGQTVSTEDDFQANSLIQLMEALSKAGLQSMFVEMDISNPLDIRLLTGDNITVKLGQPENLTDKLSWVARALPELAAMGKSGGTLYVTGTNGATYSESQAADEDQDMQGGDNQDGENQDGENQDGENQDGESQDGESQDGDNENDLPEVSTPTDAP